MLAGCDEDDTVILAFAGHGVQFKGERSSYFCPLDVDLEQVAQVCRRALILTSTMQNPPAFDDTSPRLRMPGNTRKGASDFQPVILRLRIEPLNFRECPVHFTSGRSRPHGDQR